MKLRLIDDGEPLPADTQEELKGMLVSVPASPAERCGFILKDGTVHEVKNISDRAHVQFIMDPQEQLRICTYAYDEILGVFHTHPSGIAKPSRQDNEGWPKGSPWRYFIVTKNEITEWRKDGSRSSAAKLAGKVSAGSVLGR